MRQVLAVSALSDVPHADASPGYAENQMVLSSNVSHKENPNSPRGIETMKDILKSPSIYLFSPVSVLSPYF